MDICFVVMPLCSVNRPALGVSLLQAGLRNIGIPSKIHYFNLPFAEKIEEEYDRMAEVIALISHLHPPNGASKISLNRFSPYFIEPFENGITNVRPLAQYNMIYPFSEDRVRKMAYHFEFDYSDGRDPSIYVIIQFDQLYILQS